MVRTQRRINNRSKPIGRRKQTKNYKNPTKKKNLFGFFKKILTRKVKKQRGG
jgi:hypothetical protein